MPFSSVKQVADAVASTGEFRMAYAYKPSIASVGSAGRWQDTSMSTGFPKYNAYVGTQLEATVLTGSANNGIYVGPVPSGKTRHLLNMGAMNTSATFPLSLILCDYLMFYPLVDQDNTDTQYFDNTATLTRYATGEGVRLMFINSVQSLVAGVATIEYRNQAGVLKTTTSGFLPSILGASQNNAFNGVSTFASTPFFPLASGDSGIRSLESITYTTPPGGFCNAVLVKPLATLTLHEQNTYSEVSYVSDKMVLPEIKNGAYLQFMAQSTIAAGMSITSELTFIEG